MNYDGTRKKKQLLQSAKTDLLPPREWIETQCALYIAILQQYLQAYSDREEATARAHECLDNVFNKYRHTKRDHPRRRAFLKQLSAFMRASVSEKDKTRLQRGETIERVSNTNVKCDSKQPPSTEMVNRYFTALIRHLETLSQKAETRVERDMGTSELDAKRKTNVRLMQRMRESWHRKRADAKEALQHATTERNYADMNRCRALVDKAEQMCLYYARVLNRTRSTKSKWSFTTEDAKFESNETNTTTATTAATAKTTKSKDDETPFSDNGIVEASEEEFDMSGPFLTLLHNGLSSFSQKEDYEITQTEQAVADTLKRFVDDNIVAQDYAGKVELAAFLAAITDCKNSECALFRLVGSLTRATQAYQLAYTSLLQGIAITDVQQTLRRTLPRDKMFETTICPNSALDIRCLSTTNANRENALRTETEKWLEGNSSRIDYDSEQVQVMIDTLTENLPTPFSIVRGVNDARAYQLRSAAFCKSPHSLRQWNDVCQNTAADRHGIMDVLNGSGRSFTQSELVAADKIRQLFLAEPGCFQIHTYYEDCNQAIDASVAAANAIVRIERPHVTLTHAVLASGSYVLSKTIYLPGIDKGKTVAVRSHIVEELRTTSSSSSAVRRQKPIYETHVYDSAAVERILRETPAQWMDVYDLAPIQTLHSGNATLFIAAKAVTSSFPHTRNSNDTSTATGNDARECLLEPLGFIVAGNAGKCLSHLSNGNATQLGHMVRNFETYTQSVYVSSSTLDMLYIDSLCGSGSISSAAATTTTTTGGASKTSNTRTLGTTKKPRGVGYFLMAKALAYHARAEPSGVLMNVRGGSGSLGDFSIDASVAFYYYRHFHMRVVAQKASEVAHACGLQQVEQHYRKNRRDTVTKRELKQDGVYSHVSNIVSCVQEHGNADNTPIPVQTLCGSKPNTEIYRFLQDFVTVDKAVNDGSSAKLLHWQSTTDGMMFRTYPHAVELRSRVLRHFEKLCAKTQKTQTDEQSSNLCAIVNTKQTTRSKGWEVLQQDSFCCYNTPICRNDNNNDMNGVEQQCAESVSESLGAW